MKPSHLVILLCLFTSAGYAGGPSTIPGDQCDMPFMDFDSYAEQFPGVPQEIVQRWYDTALHELEAACAPPANPWAPPPGMYDDATLLAFLLGDGSSHPHGPAPQPTPIPLPPSGWLYGAILALAMFLGRKR